MSEWKVGDKAFIEVEIVDPAWLTFRLLGETGRILNASITCPLFRSIPPSQPASVDVSAIRVGDEVTVRGVVVSEASPMREKVLVEFHESLSGWVSERLIASHTPAPRPTTLAEFEALPLKVRERLFAEMVKDGAK